MRLSCRVAREILMDCRLSVVRTGAYRSSNCVCRPSTVSTRSATPTETSSLKSSSVTCSHNKEVSINFFAFSLLLFNLNSLFHETHISFSFSFQARIKCKDLVKKVALYEKRLAVRKFSFSWLFEFLLPDKYHFHIKSAIYITIWTTTFYRWYYQIGLWFMDCNLTTRQIWTISNWRDYKSLQNAFFSPSPLSIFSFVRSVFYDYPSFFAVGITRFSLIWPLKHWHYFLGGI